MLIIGTFEHSLELEQALAAVERIGVNPARILAVGMDASTDPRTVAGKRTVDGVEVGLACATALAVIGSSVGFILAWGPIVWGLIAALAGFAIGYALRSLGSKRTGSHRRPRTPWPEVTVFVECLDEQSQEIRGILRRYGALSTGCHTR
ncbi:hypothetical protein [Cohnella nanjingensis]|uniref:DUF1269 domain-containing protein n=1 Tax=Cohnella nanjingensis TaxID=1387779 RepID=A0A7X0RLG3_9BACL|nr:hypothetical protein [Cohnella nanjingensis]MBB6669635.1 hypothetical protein [Cohnella nanjingensis]